MNPNLQELQAYISIAKDIITGFAALTAAIVAVIGLRAWRSQLKGKTEYELAQRVLRAVYKVRDAMHFVRHPFMSASEISQAMKEAGIEGNPLDAKVNARSQEAAYQKRWTKVQEAWADLDLNTLEAEALWGQEIREKLKPLRQCVSTLFASIQTYLRGLATPPRELDAQRMERTDNVIYGSPEDADRNPFTAEIIKAVGQVENFLKPRLKL